MAEQHHQQSSLPNQTHENSAAAPETGKDLRLKQQVQDMLAATPGGVQLDRYFGITSGQPEQPREEARESAQLLRELQKAPSSPGDLQNLLARISEHAGKSGADQDALRALIYGSKGKKDS